MRRLLLAMIAMSVAGLVMVATPSMAVHKNYDNKLVCGGCHTMHNSQGNSSLGGNSGGSLILLRGAVSTRAEVHNLCLQCHASNGAQATATFGADNHPAPKVYIDGAGGGGNGFDTSGDFKDIGAGGDFSAALTGDSTGWTANDGSVAQGKGHSLGLTSATPPGADDGAVSNFTCTSCHDPHGAYTSVTAYANVFRNLKTIPRDSGETSNIILHPNIRSYVGMGGCASGSGNWISGENGGGNDTAVWPVYRTGAAFDGTDTSDCASAGGRVNAYGVSTGDDGSSSPYGIGYWCAACHDQWHEDNATTNQSGNDWRRHPVDNLLSDGTPQSGGSVTIVDTTNYAAARSAGKALPVAYASDTTTTNAVYYLESGAESNYKVFCLSCHFAHGGPYYDNLRWDYLSAVGSGSQSANSIASNVGCQLCHNR